METSKAGTDMNSLITKSGRYEVGEYNPKDLSSLNVGLGALEVVEFLGAGNMDKNIAANGPAFSAYFDGGLFAIAGINIMWHGVGEAWAMFGDSYVQHGFFIHRTTLRFLDRLSDDLKLQRLQAVVAKGHWAGVQWVDRLGFKYEGEMEAYFRGKTFLRYAKIYGGK